MNKPFLMGAGLGILLIVLVYGTSWYVMSSRDRMFGSQGILMFQLAFVEILVGLSMLCFKKTRQWGAGILLASLVALLIGESICSRVFPH